MADTRIDLVRQFLPALSNLKRKESQLLKKSRENDELGIHLPEIAETYKQADVISKAVNECFSILKSEYHTGKINQVRFVDNLKSYRNFLEKGIDTSDLPPALNTLDILDEVEKYLDPLPEIRQFIVAKNRAAIAKKNK